MIAQEPPNLGQTTWPQDMLTPSDPNHSYSPGITKLLALYSQINALLSTFAGTYSGQLTNSLKNTGVEDTLLPAVAFVSIAKLNRELQDCIFAVMDAESKLKRKQLAIRLGLGTTSEPTNKP